MQSLDTAVLIDLGLAALGGVAGVFVNQWLAKLGIGLSVAAIGTTVVATVLALLLGGRSAVVAGSVAAASAGRLALVWMESLATGEGSPERVGHGAQG